VSSDPQPFLAAITALPMRTEALDTPARLRTPSPQRPDRAASSCEESAPARRERSGRVGEGALEPRTAFAGDTHSRTDRGDEALANPAAPLRPWF